MQNKQSELQCTLQVQATPRPVLWRRLQHPTVSPHLSPSISKDPRVIKDRVGRVALWCFRRWWGYLFIYFFQEQCKGLQLVAGANIMHAINCLQMVNYGQNWLIWGAINCLPLIPRMPVDNCVCN